MHMVQTYGMAWLSNRVFNASPRSVVPLLMPSVISRFGLVSHLSFLRRHLQAQEALRLGGTVIFEDEVRVELLILILRKALDRDRKALQKAIYLVAQVLLAKYVRRRVFYAMWMQWRGKDVARRDVSLTAWLQNEYRYLTTDPTASNPALAKPLSSDEQKGLLGLDWQMVAMLASHPREYDTGWIIENNPETGQLEPRQTGWAKQWDMPALIQPNRPSALKLLTRKPGKWGYSLLPQIFPVFTHLSTYQPNIKVPEWAKTDVSFGGGQTKRVRELGGDEYKWFGYRLVNRIDTMLENLPEEIPLRHGLHGGPGEQANQNGLRYRNLWLMLEDVMAATAARCLWVALLPDGTGVATSYRKAHLPKHGGIREEFDRLAPQATIRFQARAIEKPYGQIFKQWQRANQEHYHQARRLSLLSRSNAPLNQATATALDEDHDKRIQHLMGLVKQADQEAKPGGGTAFAHPGKDPKRHPHREQVLRGGNGLIDLRLRYTDEEYQDPRYAIQRVFHDRLLLGAQWFEDKIDTWRRGFQDTTREADQRLTPDTFIPLPDSSSDEAAGVSGVQSYHAQLETFANLLFSN